MGNNLNNLVFTLFPWLCCLQANLTLSISIWNEWNRMLYEYLASRDTSKSKSAVLDWTEQISEIHWFGMTIQNRIKYITLQQITINTSFIIVPQSCTNYTTYFKQQWRTVVETRKGGRMVEGTYIVVQCRGAGVLLYHHGSAPASLLHDLAMMLG